MYVINMTFEKEQLPFFLLLPKLELYNVVTNTFSKILTLELKKKKRNFHDHIVDAFQC